MSHRGYLGVDFFFAISGFLITTLLVREFTKTGQISLGNFYARRALRILPLYYAVLGVYVATIWLTERGSTRGSGFFSHLPAYLTYTSNWFVDLAGGESVPFYFSWSLATEEQFYLLWPPILVIALRLSRGRTWLPVAAIVALLSVTIPVRSLSGSQNLLGTMVGSVPMSILLAALAALVAHNRAGFRALQGPFGASWSAPVIFALLVIGLVSGFPDWVIRVLMVAAVVSVGISETTAMHPFLRMRPLVFIGLISYGIYLMHMLCANVVREIVGRNFGIETFLTTSLLVVGVALFSFRYFETPLLRIKRRFEIPDGVVNGQLVVPSGGHVEVPTPRG